MPSLLLGCGNSRDKKIALEGSTSWVEPLVTIDMNPNCGADIVHDLNIHPLPFPDDHFDEMGAFDVLEHLGTQGDWKGWFTEFAEYWRILKPGGLFFIVNPVNQDWFADPGHTRFISGGWFRFLDQGFYDLNLSDGRPVTDYRWFYKADFETVVMEPNGNHHTLAVLRKR